MQSTVRARLRRSSDVARASEPASIGSPDSIPHAAPFPSPRQAYSTPQPTTISNEDRHGAVPVHDRWSHPSAARSEERVKLQGGFSMGDRGAVRTREGEAKSLRSVFHACFIQHTCVVFTLHLTSHTTDSKECSSSKQADSLCSEEARVRATYRKEIYNKKVPKRRQQAGGRVGARTGRIMQDM
ncbi:hypothetical protein B0H14DRAFT_2564869 [Mycena olivaceomarginata]|nr:hypothetical protein B0H14DRAFT_2564869 [Mycena olivaceomarginata]